MLCKNNLLRTGRFPESALSTIIEASAKGTDLFTRQRTDFLPASADLIAFRFGYVEFENLDDATAAIEGLNQHLFRGRRMAVQYHKKRESNLTQPREPNTPSKTLFIGNMSFEMSDKDLNDLFREVRNVVDVRVAIDRRTGQPRGFAHADFIDTDSATKAKELLQAKEVYGRRLRVDFSRSSARPSSQ